MKIVTNAMKTTETAISAADYRLVGGAGDRALALGLVDGNWYKTRIPREQMKALMRRDDAHALRDTLLWFALLSASAILAYALKGSYWALPAFLLYGALYGGASDSRWHESGHGTAFRTRWMNDALYQIASFMVLRRPTVWRWSHARHHSETLITGRDPEISVQRPPALMKIAANLFALHFGATVVKAVFLNALGKISADEQSYIPKSEHARVVREARVWLLVYLALATGCVVTGSALPLLFVGLPSLYGSWLYVFFGLTQHAGLPENVLDHRLNCRTVYMNPVFRFLYWNMNYHVEHHMFPMVPYHALDRLHEAIKDDCPPAYTSSWQAYRELIPAILRQRKDPSYHINRPLPK